MKLIYRGVLALALVCFLCGTYAWPQAGTGALTGMVTDPTGAIIVGATVELTNPDVGATRSTVTTSGGIYRFTALPIVGTYTLTVQQTGFKAVKIEGLRSRWVRPSPRTSGWNWVLHRK